ncbi:hypothetical protein MSG28_007928 [Choristoneura fumiferana]|uniref:Uncharacterized protein n=1 Tax=Choristoneura fumiferana TaxID=7141 RepID=A0ACC0J995_CHOFU|nr:hypothetical protein MSG28_007928 [Choristoneura fumiferana]
MWFCVPACGVVRGGRIIGGVSVVNGEYPWLAGIIRDDRFVCGATVLARDHLMTAAHCVSSVDVSRLKVLVGVHNITDPMAKTYSVRTVTEHPDFNSYNYDNDIAIIRLTEPVPESIFRPLCLPEDGDSRMLSNEEAIVSGWGSTEEKGYPTDTPNKVTVRIWDQEECANAGYGRRKVTPRMLCANAPDKDACTGDSGGPLLLSHPYNHVVGVVSWGRGCARVGYPGVYTRVLKFLPWLKKALRNACLCSPPYY